MSTAQSSIVTVGVPDGTDVIILKRFGAELTFTPDARVSLESSTLNWRNYDRELQRQIEYGRTLQLKMDPAGNVLHIEAGVNGQIMFSRILGQLPDPMTDEFIDVVAKANNWLTRLARSK